MKSTQYSEKVLDHFRNPRNSGILEGEDVVMGRVGNPVCGDLMEVYLKVNENKIEDIKFKTFGCGSAIATASMVSELAKGKTIDAALEITRKDVADELDGLPPIKMHCSNLAADALHDAIKNYHNRQKSESVISEDVPQKRKEISGEKQFHKSGVFYAVSELSTFINRRVMVLDTGSSSLQTALELTKYTPRVIFVTCSKDISAYGDLKTTAKQSDVKILYESELLEISGINEVEKVRVHDLNEDEEYDLFIDSIVIL